MKVNKLIASTSLETSMKTLAFDLDDMRTASSQACRLMKVLANSDRLLILCQLIKGERRVGELEELLGIVQPTLSQQLSVLRDEELVSARREGKSIYYALTSSKALAVIEVLHKQFCNSRKVRS
jgi:DNA-binding transcriptional ArsR family regulator